MKVKDLWKYLYRAVDKEGKTIDLLLTAKRDTAAANGLPETVILDKNGANKAAMDEINASLASPC